MRTNPTSSPLRADIHVEDTDSPSDTAEYSEEQLAIARDKLMLKRMNHGNKVGRLSRTGLKKKKLSREYLTLLYDA